MCEGKRLEDYYIIKNGKKLQYGYTTGSCAAAAAKAAAFVIFGQNEINKIDLMTPKGILLELKVEVAAFEKESVTCAVVKHAGDDPDVTHGIKVFARVTKCKAAGVFIDGGIGVGRVTKKGLEQPVGSAAINKIPRRMITQELEEIAQLHDYEGGLQVLIEIPEGVKLAKKTFNPRLGIQGGISVLGTTGIVVPMSEGALIKSIEVEMKMRIENGNEYLLITPGNYGETFLKEYMQLDFTQNIKCSNYIGAAIDMAVNMGAKGMLLVSHIGKIVKVSGGIMNTHSRDADARVELMAAHSLRAGADISTVQGILNTTTTDEALEILNDKNLIEATMEQMLERIEFYLQYRSYGQIEIGAVVFSNEFGYLGQTKSAERLIQKLSITVE